MDEDKFKEELGKTLVRMGESLDKKLYETKEEYLREEYFHFVYDPERSDVRNLYEFYGALKHYHTEVRRWEEKHNGTCCVVERVRDKYLYPEIKRFLSAQRHAHESKTKENQNAKI